MAKVTLWRVTGIFTSLLVLVAIIVIFIFFLGIMIVLIPVALVLLLIAVLFRRGKKTIVKPKQKTHEVIDVDFKVK